MTFTAPNRSNSIKMMLLGSGELGKEVVIEASRLGIETIAVDRYPHAPAHQVASHSHVIDMKNFDDVLDLIEKEKPHFILPEIEAINIDALFEAEKRGYCVIPNAKAVSLTMNRKGIRVFAAEELGLKTSRYRFVKTLEELTSAAHEMGFPCVIKPVMSSSGHGQSVCKTADDIVKSWEIAKEARGDASELIVEEFIRFDYEITLLTARNETGTVFCPPIGHIQQDGDYIYSWQPIAMSHNALTQAQEIAKKVTDGLGGRGLFGVELFVQGEDVYFSEVSPRPHDTGMVTMITQNQSEFALHVRAVLGLPLNFELVREGASAAYKAKNDSKVPQIIIDPSIYDNETFVRIFGKPESHHGRRMAVILTTDTDATTAKIKAQNKISLIQDR